MRATSGVLVLALAAALSAQGGLGGVWEAVRVNQQPLPMTDRVTGKDGATHVVRLHSMILRLRQNGRFQAALRYQRAILSKGQKIETQPLLNDTWVGPYTISGSHMQFVPEKQGDQKVQPFTGEMAGQRITITFDYEIVTRKHYVLEMNRNDKIF